MKWFYADQGLQKGPIDESALNDLVLAGVVRDDTLVWNEGMPAWQTHGSQRGAAPTSMPLSALPRIRGIAASAGGLSTPVSWSRLDPCPFVRCVSRRIYKNCVKAGRWLVPGTTVAFGFARRRVSSMPFY